MVYDSMQAHRLRERQKCLEILIEIRGLRPDLGQQPATAAKKLDFLFLTEIENPKTRANKIRRLFKGEFAETDGYYLNMILNYCRHSKELAEELVRRYK